MSEINKTKKMSGATELRKACVLLLNSNEATKLETTSDYTTEIKKNVSSPIVLERSGDVLTISKRSGQDNFDKIDFQFKFKLSFVESKTEWWPIFFNDSTGRTIAAEVQMGNKVLTNVQKQNELIELANTWAKSISSQSLTRTIDGIL